MRTRAQHGSTESPFPSSGTLVRVFLSAIRDHQSSILNRVPAPRFAGQAEATAKDCGLLLEPVFLLRGCRVSVQEIERKFLIRGSSLPDGLDSIPRKQISQGYLAVSPDGTEVRLRRKGDRCYLTVKSPGALQRTEREIELTSDQFEHLWPATSGRRLEKTRYLIQLNDHQIELDQYAGALAGLLVAEVEFPTIEASQAFAPPDWFGREVTQDERYKNRNLALYGLDAEIH